MSAHLTPTDLDRPIAAYLAHQRALGRGYHKEEYVLTALRNFLAEQGANDLTPALFQAWCDTLASLHANTRRGRQLIVQRFCRYRHRMAPDCFVPDSWSVARAQPYVRPIIVAPEQMARALAAADVLAPTPSSPLRPAVMRLAIVLLYTAGLRRGELLRLTLEDVDAAAGILRIRSTKFHKSRWVPLSPSARRELRHYLHQRCSRPLATHSTAPLLCHTAEGRRGYTGTGITQNLQALFTAAQIHDAEGRRPRIHDLRHGFAVQALLRWYQAGADVHVELPKLALYMGHVNIASTAAYLCWHPTVAGLASQRFEKEFGDLLREVHP